MKTIIVILALIPSISYAGFFETKQCRTVTVCDGAKCRPVTICD
jgi:hypothetical protein